MKLNGLHQTERGKQMTTTTTATDYEVPTISINLNDAAFLAMMIKMAVNQDPSLATPHVQELYAKLMA